MIGKEGSKESRTKRSSNKMAMNEHKGNEFDVSHAILEKLSLHLLGGKMPNILC